jgi:hypothetical protein
MREMDRLVSMLFPVEGQKLVDLKFFPGEQSVTVEEFCEEAHAAFVQIDSGQSPAQQNFTESFSRVSVDRFLTNG